MVQGWKKNNYIECIYTLKDFINDLDNNLNRKEKRAAIVENFDFLTEDEISIFTNIEIFNILDNIKDFEFDEFIDALYKYGSCISNLFVDGYPIDPISYEKLTDHKEIGVYNGTGYSKNSIFELGMHGSTINPMTGEQLSPSKYEEFRDKSEYEGDLHELMHDKKSGNSLVGVNRKISF